MRSASARCCRFSTGLHQSLALPMVYVTHALTEVTRLGDHVLLMQAGRITASGATLQMLSQLEGPLAHDEDAGVVLPCTVGERDARWHLARMDFDGGSLVVRDSGHAVGSAVRVRVPARDVSLALAEPKDSSIVNTLRGEVRALVPDTHPAAALALVQIGSVSLIARLTHQSAAQAGPRPGRAGVGADQVGGAVGVISQRLTWAALLDSVTLAANCLDGLSRGCRSGVATGASFASWRKITQRS